jgi:hypothetical protein
MMRDPSRFASLVEHGGERLPAHMLAQLPHIH